MAEPRLIADYRSALSRRLPGPLADEIADGLAETYEYYVATGVAPDQAAQTALAEFGDADTIALAFAIDAPARHAAHALLATGPVAGTCWFIALVSGHAWHWVLPGSATAGIGITLVAIISLLACAARTGSYRLGRRAMTAACLALITLDCSLITAMALPSTARAWPAALAVAAGTLRAAFTTRTLRRVRAD